MLIYFKVEYCIVKMNEHNWLRSMKNKVNKLCNEAVFTIIYHKSYERLPPRLNYRGLSFAARSLGHGIRNFTKEKTGKDLGCLRDNVTRNKILKILSDLRLTISNYDTRNNLLNLVVNHSSNFTSALSPEGDESSYSKQEFKKHANLHNFIATYHKICMQQEQSFGESRHSTNIKQKSKTSKKNIPEVVSNLTHKKHTDSCKCNGVNAEIDKNNLRFTGCWLHTGIPEADLDK